MRRYLFAGIPLVILLILVGFRINAERAAASQLDGQQKNRGKMATAVETVIAGPRLVKETIDAVGSVEPLFNVPIQPRTSGYYRTVLVREGDIVKAGQVLATIDAREARAAMLNQSSQVTEARARLAEAEATSLSNDVGIQSAIRQAQANLTAASADFQQVSRNQDATVAAAESAVDDAAAKVASANATVKTSQADLVAAQAALKNAEQRQTRANSLVEKGYISQAEADDAVAAYQSALAQVDVEKAQISADQGAVASAKAQEVSAQRQLDITRQKVKADVAAAQAKVDQARAALTLATSQRAQSAAYQRNLEALRASVQSAQAELSSAQVAESDTVLTSPVDGTVTQRIGDPGSLAAPGTAILTIQNVSDVIVRSSIPVEQAAKVRPGQQAVITLQGLDTPRTGTVWQVNQSADTKSRQFDVLVRLPNRDKTLRPGMFGNVSIQVQARNVAVALPIDAVKGKDGASTVTTVDAENVAHVIKVVTAPADGGWVDIRSGLSPGDRVILLSYAPVKDGGKVSPKDHAEQTEESTRDADENASGNRQPDPVAK